MRSREAARLLGVSLPTLRAIPLTQLTPRPMNSRTKRGNSPHLYALEDLSRYQAEKLRLLVRDPEDGRWEEWFEGQLRMLAEEPARWADSPYPRATWHAVRDAIRHVNRRPDGMCARPWPWLNTHGHVVLGWDNGDLGLATCLFTGTGMYRLTVCNHGAGSHLADMAWPDELVEFAGMMRPDKRGAARRALNI